MAQCLKKTTFLLKVVSVESDFKLRTYYGVCLLLLFFRTLQDHKILGFPVRIGDNKYARNAFHFNLCFVCDSDARTVQYESVVTKLSDYLMGMEMENGFLSVGNTNQKLAPILKQVLRELNTKGEYLSYIYFYTCEYKKETVKFNKQIKVVL